MTTLPLSADKVSKLAKQPFEDFCEALIRNEGGSLFPVQQTRVRGPSPEDVADGGRDIEFIAYEDASTPVNNSLTPPTAQRVWFSCKSSKTVHGWKDLVRKDVDPSPRLYDARKGQKSAKAKDIIAEARKEPSKGPKHQLLDILRKEGGYRILINVRGVQVSEFEQELVERLRLWIEALYPDEESPSSAELERRVRVFDASDVAAAFNRAPFALASELEAALKLDDREFWSWDEWPATDPGRRLIEFLPDPERASQRAALDAFLADAAPTVTERVFHIAGAPGVGKTRFVYDTLANSSVNSARVRYTVDRMRAQQALREGYLDRVADVVLVVDEVEAYDADLLANAFLQAGPNRSEARLIIIGPRDDQRPPARPPTILQPLGRATTRELIAKDLRSFNLDAKSQAELERTTLELSEGYPLFALWLARGLAEDSELLERDPEYILSGGKPLWQVLGLVFVGARGDRGIGVWTVEVDGCIRAALLTILTYGQDWTEFDQATETRCARALDSDWATLMQRAAHCRGRGLLREVPRGKIHRYISPRNLERMVLDYYFGGPDGPERLRRMSRQIEDAGPRLLERARLIHAKQALPKLGEGLLLDVPDGPWPGRRALLDAAHRCPELAARVLARATSSDPLAHERGGALGGVLASLAHRDLDFSIFEVIEAALFRLLVIARGSHHEPHARSQWAALFVPRPNTYYSPPRQRAGLLMGRLGDAASLPAALAGVDALGDALGAWLAPFVDARDGQWPETSSAESVNVHQGIWDALLLLCVGKTPGANAKTLEQARHAAVRHVRAGLGAGLDAPRLNAWADGVDAWSVSQRNELLEQLDEALRFDRQGFDEALLESLLTLREALAPRDLYARLVAQVGRHWPGSWKLDEDQRDALQEQEDSELARALLAEPEHLARAWAWLGTEAAYRGPSFSAALGHVDEELSTYAQLVQLRSTPRHDQLLANYLWGWGQRVGPERLDARLEQDARDPLRRPFVARALVIGGGTDTRAGMILELLNTPDPPVDALRGVGYWRWAQAIRVALIEQLATKFAELREFVEALGLWSQRLKRSHDGLSEAQLTMARHILERASAMRLVSVAEVAWATTLVRLARADDGQTLALFAEVLTDPQRLLNLHYPSSRALRGLREAGLSEQLWAELGPALERRPDTLSQLEPMLSQVALLDDLGERVLLDWVGQSDDRGALLTGLLHPYAQELASLGAALIERFGPGSHCASVLSARAISTPRAVSSLAHFFDKQAELARGWAARAQGPAVREWATVLAEELACRSVDQHAAEHYRRRA